MSNEMDDLARRMIADDMENGGPVENLIDTGSQNVTGYKRQTQAHLDLVNEVKQYEADSGFWLERVYFAFAKENGIPLDPRQVTSARTHFEYGFYHLSRAVFRPADPIGDAVTEGLRHG